MGESLEESRTYLPRVGDLGRACLIEATLAGGQITAVEARKRIELKQGYALDGSIHKSLNNTNIFEIADEGPPKLYSITEYGSLILGESIANLDPKEIVSIKRAFLLNVQESSDS